MSSPANPARRLVEFDGLRGVAALVVMISHLVQTTPLFWSVFQSQAPVTPLVLLLKLAPIHTLWAGPLMVHIFFMLSGLVLLRSLPAKFDESGRKGKWVARRLLRLYLPIWAAVLLTFALTAFFPRGGYWLSEWGNSFNLKYSFLTFMQDLFVIRGTTPINPPLWSLQFEIYFSLVLPFVNAVYEKSSRFLEKVFPLICLVVPSLTLWPYTEYFAMFLIGFWLGKKWDHICSFYQVLSHKKLFSKTLPIQLFLLIFVLDNNSLSYGNWSLLPATFQVFLQLIGVAMLIVYVGNAPSLRKTLSTSPAQTLGRISFSLYLTHVPILFLLVSVIPNFWVSLPLGFALAIAFAFLFEKAVERPSHQLAKSKWRRGA